MTKDNKYYLLKTIDEIDIIISYSKELDLVNFNNNPAIVDGVIFRMIQMSEHMNKISQDFKDENPNIDWNSIKGFRNRLVHNYGGVDLTFVYLAITVDIPALREEIKKAINNS